MKFPKKIKVFKENKKMCFVSGDLSDDDFGNRKTLPFWPMWLAMELMTFLC